MKLRKYRLVLEALESRLAPTAYTVDRPGDAGNGAGDRGDLRYIINRLRQTKGQTKGSG